MKVLFCCQQKIKTQLFAELFMLNAGMKCNTTGGKTVFYFD